MPTRLMIFLIEYDRRHGQLANLTVFPDEHREAAENARLELELELNRTGVLREVVLLEAPSERALRLTHRRSFEQLSDLIEAPASIEQQHL